MDKATFLEELYQAREDWENLLNEVGEERMLQPGANGEWSVKDVIAHIMWSEREIVGVCEERALVGSELWKMTDDERNPIIVSWYRDRSLQEVQAEEKVIYARLLALLQTVSTEELNDPRHFREMPSDWLPWQIFAGCTFKHYHDHIQPIRAWLDRQEK